MSSKPETRFRRRLENAIKHSLSDWWIWKLRDAPFSGTKPFDLLCLSAGPPPTAVAIELKVVKLKRNVFRFRDRLKPHQLEGLRKFWETGPGFTRALIFVYNMETGKYGGVEFPSDKGFLKTDEKNVKELIKMLDKKACQ